MEELPAHDQSQDERLYLDLIYPYRGDHGSGHLRLRFEELLSAKLSAEIENRRDDRSLIAMEYVEYLKASLANVPATNGGYFGC